MLSLGPMAKVSQEKTVAGLIDRETLAQRWCCSVETIKRMERSGKLRRVALCERLVRYRLDDIFKLEEVRA